MHYIIKHRIALHDLASHIILLKRISNNALSHPFAHLINHVICPTFIYQTNIERFNSHITFFILLQHYRSHHISHHILIYLIFLVSIISQHDFSISYLTSFLTFSNDLYILYSLFFFYHTVSYLGGKSRSLH